MDKFIDVLQEESARQLNRDDSCFSLDISLYDPWNFYRTLQLLVKEHDMDMTFQSSSLGMGIQASITIAILRAYAEMNLPNKTPIFIDEPELYLHPQAQKNFYNLLREMTLDEVDGQGGIVREGLQIFYTTHSPNFLRTDKFNEIFVVRKDKDQGTYINNANPKSFCDDLYTRQKIQTNDEELMLHFYNAYENTGDSQRANEAFFATKVVLVEGQSESLILPYFFGLHKFDYIKDGISIVCCGTKDELDRFFRLYNEFGIPCYMIFDGDKQHEGTPSEDNTKRKNIDLLSLFGEGNIAWPDGIPSDRYLAHEKTFEDTFGFETSSKGLKLFKEVKEIITDGSSTPAWAPKLIDKLKKMDSPLSSVLQTSHAKDDTEVPF